MSINSLNSSMLRLSGMSSGLDTEMIVESLLLANTAKVDKQKQATTKLEWKADALREVNSLIRIFRESNLSVLNTAGNMLSPATYNTFSVTMNTTSSAVSVSAGSSANAGRLTINSVTQLATAAGVKSADAFSGESLNMNASLKDLAMANAFVFDEGELEFAINGQSFTFTEDSTLGELLGAVNSSEAGVKMAYSSLTKGFSITSKTTGSASRVEIGNVRGNAFAAQDSAFGIAEGLENGQDAILTIEDRTITRSANTFSIDGVTYTLKEKTDEPVSFTVEQDLDATVDKVAAFIDSYNTLIDKLQSLLDEKAYRTYPPLTEEQKAQMTEADIKLWEGYARSGLLRGDANISSLLGAMRSAFTTVLEGTGMRPSDLGLSTGLYHEKGRITVDKNKLRIALENNPDAVRNMFIQTSSSADAAEAFAGSGLIARLSGALLRYTQQSTSNTLTHIDKQISESKTRADALLDKLTARESALWRQFTAMEKALSTLNSQSNWLSSIVTGWSNK